MRKAPARACLCAGALLLAGCGHATTAGRRPAPAAPFGYDRSRPLAFEDGGRVNRNYPIAIRDVSFAGRSGRVRAYLVVPPVRKRLPAVVYLHGSGGDRRELLVPATWLAARGAVALALTAPSASARPAPGLAPVAQLRRQRAIVAGDVIAVRRAVDLLRSLPEVDPHRIGLVGWSAGARTGAIVAGVERRIRAFVLMSGGASPISEYLADAPASLRPQLEPVLRQIDPLGWIARARPGTVLLEDGRRDEIVPHAALAALTAAAPSGTSVRWYEAGHALDAAAYRDQLAWLTRKLGIHDRVAGASVGP